MVFPRSAAVSTVRGASDASDAWSTSGFVNRPPPRLVRVSGQSTEPGAAPMAAPNASRRQDRPPGGWEQGGRSWLLEEELFGCSSVVLQLFECRPGSRNPWGSCTGVGVDGRIL